MIEHDTALCVDDPAMVGHIGLAELLGVAAPADGMDQFDVIAVHSAPAARASLRTGGSVVNGAASGGRIGCVPAGA